MEKVPFVETNVYGEPPVQVDEDAAADASIASFLKPSKGIFGAFGDRSYETQDKPHELYLAQFPDGAHLLAGQPVLRGTGLVKIGISGNIKNRLKALNISFPKTSTIGWKIIRTAKFPNRASVGDAEAAFKLRSVKDFGAISLGKEFFVMDLNKAETLFNSLSPASGLDLRLTTKRKL